MESLAFLKVLQNKLSKRKLAWRNPARLESGGASRDRTDDLLLAKQALSQLSYGPGLGRTGQWEGVVIDPTFRATLVGLGGVEPPTSPLSGVRSNHLSYRPSRAGRVPELPATL
jgi:hypothetical protein